MHAQKIAEWKHDHVFGQDQQRAGEWRTILIVVVAAAMMVVEISAGLIYGSMALLADGLHMTSHATALGIAAFAYVVSRKLASDRRFTFGVGKINSLAGFASAVLLMGFALAMAVESSDRLLNPLDIAFDQALIVAVIGLVVNGASAWLLMTTPHGHDHGHDHHHHGHDHNLRAAYFHVLADAVTSLLAIIALLAGKYMGASWLDPVMGIVGAGLVARWSYGLIRDTSRVLLDNQLESGQLAQLQTAIESRSSDKVSDLHVWCIGHGIFAAEIAIVSDVPQSPEHYKSRIPKSLGIVHATVEVHICANH